MTPIAFSTGARTSLLNLQTAALLVQNKPFTLIKGKTNTVLDKASLTKNNIINSTSFLSVFLDNINKSVNTINAARQDLKDIKSFLNQAKKIVQSALFNGTSVSFTGNVNITASDKTNLTASIATPGDKFTIQVGNVETKTFTVYSNTSLKDLYTQINTLKDVQVSTIPTFLGTADNGDVRAVITALKGTGIIVKDVGLGTAVKNIFGSIQISSFPANQDSLSSQFDEVLLKINKLVSNAGFRGTNLLNGDSLKKILDISGGNFDTVGLGIDRASFFISIASIQKTIRQVTDAIKNINNQESIFKNNLLTISNKTDLTYNLVNALKQKYDNSIITDLNKNSAQIIATQSSQQIGVKALSLSSDENRSVLGLFLK